MEPTYPAMRKMMSVRRAAHLPCYALIHQRNDLKKASVAENRDLPMSSGSSSDATRTSQELEAIEHRLAQAWVAGDQGAIDGMLTPDWTVIDITGRVLTKPQVMAEMFSSGDNPIVAMTIHEVTVRLFGEVAVVRGRTVARSRSNQLTAADVELRFTDVFVRQAGEWKVAISQGTPVAR